MTWTEAPTVAADQMALRRHNLGLVLRHLRDHGPLSRAQIAARTGLNKATVSSLVADLGARRLVRAGAVARGAVGRPGHTVELDGTCVCGIGVEVNVDRVSVVALDLGGDLVAERGLALDTRALSPEEVLDHLTPLVAEVMDDIAARGGTQAGITLGVAGLVDPGTGSLVVAPNLGWRDLAVAPLMAERLGGPPCSLHVENEAKLAAIAEAASRGTASDNDRRDLVVLVGEVGLGGGIISGGQLLCGRNGFAGEVGHLRVDPEGRRCGCGRVGCWETVVGLRGLLAEAADPDDTIHDPEVDLRDRLAELDRRAALGDARTISALHQVGRWLGVGAATLVHVLDPGVIVLSGYFADVGRWLLEPLKAELDAAAIAPGLRRCRVELSELGVTAVARGGAHVALETVFNNPTVVPRAATGDRNTIGGTR